MSPEHRRVLATLVVASFVQHAPLTFALVAVPAALRAQGAALWQVGLFALVFLPVVLQFTWAPAVERARARLPGGWPGWIAVTTLGIALLASAAAAVLPVPAHAIALLLLLAAVAALAGTQKIAAGGYVLEALPDTERANANAALGVGAALGTLVGTAGLTALLDAVGWTMTVGIAAAGVAALSVVPLVAPRTPPGRRDAPPPLLLELLRDPAIWRRLRMLPLLGLPVGLAYGMAQPRLVDAGLDLTQVGLVNGIGQVLAFLVAAPLITRAIRRGGAPAAASRSLKIAAGLFALLGMASLADVASFRTATVVLSVLAGLALLVSVALPTATALMGRARPGRGASELSLELCCFGLAVLVSAGASGALADALGHGGVLLAVAASCLPASWASKGIGWTGLPDPVSPGA